MMLTTAVYSCQETSVTSEDGDHEHVGKLMMRMRIIIIIIIFIIIVNVGIATINHVFLMVYTVFIPPIDGD